MEEHWPSLPSIRTSSNHLSNSASSKVSCEETLNLDFSTRPKVTDQPIGTPNLIYHADDDGKTLKNPLPSSNSDESLYSVGGSGNQEQPQETRKSLNPKSIQSTASNTPMHTSSSTRLPYSSRASLHGGIFTKCFSNPHKFLANHNHHHNLASPKTPRATTLSSNSSSPSSSNANHHMNAAAMMMMMMMKDQGGGGMMKARSASQANHTHSTAGPAMNPHGHGRATIGSPASSRHMSKMPSSNSTSTSWSASQSSSSSGSTASPKARNVAWASKSGGMGSHHASSNSYLIFTPTIRTSKGHPHASAFTMMPPDVVGKKKPSGYESDEPTSPVVTCIGRVRRKKVTWDALVRDTNTKTNTKVIKKGKATPKKLVDDHAPRQSASPFGKMLGVTTKKLTVVNNSDDVDIAKVPMQIPGGTHKSSSPNRPHEREFDANHHDNGVCQDARHASSVGRLEKDPHYISMPSSNTYVVDYDIVDMPREALTNVINMLGEKNLKDVASKPQTVQPPPDCLLLMRNSLSRSGSRHQQGDDAHHVINPALGFAYERPRQNATQNWRWGQVLT